MRLALFDVDGTLVDSRAMITASMAEAFAAVGLPPPPRDRMMAVVGLSLHTAIGRLVPAADAALHERLASAYREANWANRASGAHAEDLFEGARDLLMALQKNADVKLGIATGKGRRGVSHLLATHGMEGWFATVQTADDHPSKPDPAMVVAALAETAVAPAAAVMIGDTSYDIEMGRAAGVGTIGVTWGSHPESELRHAGAHMIAKSFKELQSCLESLWQERAA